MTEENDDVWERILELEERDKRHEVEMGLAQEKQDRADAALKSKDAFVLKV